MTASDTRGPKVETVEDLSGDLAGTFRKKEFRAAEEVDSELLQQLLAQLDSVGYVTLRGLISEESAAQMREGLQSLLGPLGRNNFEGHQTQRSYSLLAKTRAVDSLVTHPLIMAILQCRIPEALLSACQAINICPGEQPQLPHCDAGFYPNTRQHPDVALSVIWAIDPFTEENGATTVWPASHLWDEERRPSESDEHFSAVMPAGSAIVFSGKLWHGGGSNRATTSRMAMTSQYCSPWLRTQENMSLAVPPATVAKLSEELQALLGYNIHPPFMGHVNGMHPKRLLEENA